MTATPTPRQTGTSVETSQWGFVVMVDGLPLGDDPLGPIYFHCRPDARAFADAFERGDGVEMERVYRTKGRCYHTHVEFEGVIA